MKTGDTSLEMRKEIDINEFSKQWWQKGTNGELTASCKAEFKHKQRIKKSTVLLIH